MMRRISPVICILVGMLGCAKRDLRTAEAIGLLQPEPLVSAELRDDLALTQFAFGSCFSPQKDEDQIWNAVLEFEPQLFLFIGDNVYQSEEKSEPELRELREAYAMLAGVRPFTELRHGTPLLATWDDHDFGLNDAGGDWPHKALSEALFEDVWAVGDDDPRRQRDGVYFSRVVGPADRRVQFIVLDTRFFRSPLKKTDERGARGKERYVPDPDPKKTLLGEAQWQWLERQLRVPADLRFLVSSIQVIADGHGYEGWRMLPLERDRLFSVLASTHADGVVILSGDRHMGAWYRQDDGLPYPITELTSSALNMQLEVDQIENAKQELGPRRLGDVVTDANFGTVSIDWRRAEVRLELRGKDGAVLGAEVLDMRTLAADD